MLVTFINPAVGKIPGHSWNLPIVDSQFLVDLSLQVIFTVRRFSSFILNVGITPNSFFMALLHHWDKKKKKKTRNWQFCPKNLKKKKKNCHTIFISKIILLFVQMINNFRLSKQFIPLVYKLMRKKRDIQSGMFISPASLIKCIHPRFFSVKILTPSLGASIKNRISFPEIPNL